MHGRYTRRACHPHPLQGCNESALPCQIFRSSVHDCLESDSYILKNLNNLLLLLERHLVIYSEVKRSSKEGLYPLIKFLCFPRLYGFSVAHFKLQSSGNQSGDSHAVLHYTASCIVHV